MLKEVDVRSIIPLIGGLLILLFVGSAHAEYTLVTEQALGDVPANIPGSSIACWPDWNADGWPDLHIGTDIFFRNNGDGTFTQMDSLGLSPPEGHGFYRTTWADADNDGDLDAALASFNATSESDTARAHFFFNEGPPDYHFSFNEYYFAPVNTRLGQPCFIDGDRDALCEIYQATFSNWTPYGKNYDRYFEDGTFPEYWDDTSDKIPELLSNIYQRPVRGVVACDYDNDFDTDIFVPVYGVSWLESWDNCLWQNDGTGYYVDVAESAGVAIEPHGRYGIGLASGASWGDYNSDGYFDLVVGNIHGWAALYLNNLDGTFTNVTSEAGLDTSMGGGPNEKQWHNTLWVDIDNDGDLDLFLNQWYVNQGYTSYVYENEGPENPGHFREVTNEIGFNNEEEFMTDHGFAAADYDRDGDMDIFFHGSSPTFGGKYLFRNDLSPPSSDNHWLVIKLQGEGLTCGTTALNARVRLHYIDDTWSAIKQVEATSADGMMNMHPIHFGLGDHDILEEVVVCWPGGTVENYSWEDIGESVDQWITLLEGEGSSYSRFELSITPENPPVIVQDKGGSIDYNISLKSNLPYSYTFDFWTAASLAGGSEYGPIIGPVSLTFTSGLTSEVDLTQYFPGEAQAGSYRYTAYVGHYPDNIIDEDYFRIRKLGNVVIDSEEAVID
jgi:hypothetical protein